MPPVVSVASVAQLNNNRRCRSPYKSADLYESELSLEVIHSRELYKFIMYVTVAKSITMQQSSTTGYNWCGSTGRKNLGTKPWTRKSRLHSTLQDPPLLNKKHLISDIAKAPKLQSQSHSRRLTPAANVGIHNMN